MSARADFLVELGTEELPPKALLTLSEAFRDGLLSRIDAAGLAHGKVEAFATPRRLAVRVKRLLLQAAGTTDPATRATGVRSLRQERRAHACGHGVCAELRRGA